MRPTVTVAIVNWNTSDAAAAAATAYLGSEGVDAQVTIVDNCSSSAQRRQLEASAPPDATIAWAEQNRGYGWAANCVLDAQHAEVVCASNADVLPEPSMLARLAEVVLSDARIGLAGPCLSGSSGRYHAQLPSGGSLPIRALIGSWGHHTVADPPDDAVLDVEQPAGACLVATSATWRVLGGFDTEFFLWFEDVDLARRSLDAGFRNVVVGAARAGHHGGGSFVQMDRRLKQAIRLCSLSRYVAKHHCRLVPVTRVTVGMARALREVLTCSCRSCSVQSGRRLPTWRSPLRPVGY